MALNIGPSDSGEMVPFQVDERGLWFGYAIEIAEVAVEADLEGDAVVGGLKQSGSSATGRVAQTAGNTGPCRLSTEGKWGEILRSNRPICQVAASISQVENDPSEPQHRIRPVTVCGSDSF